MLTVQELKSLSSIKGKATYLVEDHFKILSFRSLTFSLEGMKYTSFCFLIRDKQIFFIDHISNPKPIKPDQFIDIIYDKIENLRNLFITYSEQIDDLEDLLFERKTPRHFLGSWFQLKKDFATIDRVFFRDSIVIQSFLKAKTEDIKEVTSKLATLANNLESDRRNCQSEMTRVDALFHYYTSLKSEKMNSNVYLLALVSGIFLPLNLVVGFFGINTENLFFEGNPNGTMNVVWIVISIFFLLILGLPTLRTIDHLLLKRLLGKYNIYHSIHKKLKLSTIKDMIEDKIDQ